VGWHELVDHLAILNQTPTIDMMTMKLKRVLILAGMTVAGAFGAQAQVGFSNPKPNREAVLDLNPATGVATKGLLLPRVELQDLTSPAPLQEHVRGMVVWNTSDAPGLPKPGLYWNDGAAWVTAPSGGAAWSLTGNAGTDTTVNFVGTTDAQPLVFRVNDTPVMRLLGNGNIAMESATVNGMQNTALGTQATVQAANWSAITGGIGNTIVTDPVAVNIDITAVDSSHHSFIAGGMYNRILMGGASAIVGGNHNTVTWSGAGIFAGGGNTVEAGVSVVAGGSMNRILTNLGGWSGIVGGMMNTISDHAAFSFIGGGSTISLSAEGAASVGGERNTVALANSVIMGGADNAITGSDATLQRSSVIAGGRRNEIMSSSSSAVLGGESHLLSVSEQSVALAGQGHQIISSPRSGVLAGTRGMVSNSPHSAIIAGNNNILENVEGAVILGGSHNTVRGIPFGAILGGTGNVIEAAPAGSDVYVPGNCLISGGTENVIRAERSTIISGANYNVIDAASLDGTGGRPGNSVIIGGEGNLIRANEAFAIGNWNQIEGDRSVAIGGYACNVIGVFSGIYGGLNNWIYNGKYNAILQGEECQLWGEYSGILGGQGNRVNGNYSVILGGQGSGVTGNYSVILGGQGSGVTGNYSVILGGPAMGLTGNNQLGFGGGSYSESNIVGLTNVDVLLNNTGAGARTSVLRYYSLDRDVGSMGAYYTGFRAPNTFPGQANIVYTLPNAQGAAGSVMSNNGSGTLSWVTATSIVNNGVVRGRVAIGNGVAQNIVINDPNVTANGVIVVTYEDPAAAGNPANIPTHAVTARAAGANFQVSFSQAPPAGANLNYMIFP
jgi:hypothetical protein